MIKLKYITRSSVRSTIKFGMMVCFKVEGCPFVEAIRCRMDEQGFWRVYLINRSDLVFQSFGAVKGLSTSIARTILFLNNEASND